MEEEVLLTETRGSVRVLTLNRPRKLNALNADLLKALTEALLAVQHDRSVAAVVIAGAGRAFSPGMDTSVPRVLTTESRKELVRTFGAVKGKIGEVVEVKDGRLVITAQGGRIHAGKVKLGEGKKVSAADPSLAAALKPGTLLGS